MPGSGTTIQAESRREAEARAPSLGDREWGPWLIVETNPLRAALITQGSCFACWFC
jgi:hypothetical protein